MVNDETRRGYLSRAGYVDSLFKSLLPDAAANEFGPICKVFRVIAEKIRSEIPPVDISEVMAEVEALLNKSIAADGYVMPPVSTTRADTSISARSISRRCERSSRGAAKPSKCRSSGRSSRSSWRGWCR